jgi:hypothetical protein
VGEAPVKLRADQYDKLKRWKDHYVFNIYVNHLGDICLRKRNKPPPRGGFIFAVTQWSTCQEDEEGYPVFQGVRGVCAKISSPVELSFEESLWSQVKCGLVARLDLLARFDRAGHASLEVLLLRRQQLLNELAKMKRSQLLECLAQQKEQRKCDAMISASDSISSSSSPEDDDFVYLSSGDENEEEMEEEEEGRVQTTESELMLRSDSERGRSIKLKKKEISKLEKLILFRYRKDFGKDLTGTVAPAAAIVANAFV